MRRYKILFDLLAVAALLGSLLVIGGGCVTRTPPTDDECARVPSDPECQPRPDGTAGPAEGEEGITGVAGLDSAVGEVSFTVTRERNGQKITSKYKGKLDGDKIKGKVTTERDGQERSVDFEAKREKA